MRFYQSFLILLFSALLLLLSGCKGNSKPPTPLETLKAYTQAIKKKDTLQMKRFLSKGSLKMAQDEAQQQSVSLDEVIQKETLFSESQSSLEYRNEKTQDDMATIEVKNFYGTWDIVPFVKEEGKWKIAKERYAEELMKQADEDNKRLDEQLNRDRQQ